MTIPEITSLIEKAKQATPGPWTRSLVHHYDQTITYIENDSDEIIIETVSGIEHKNYAFITAANPSAILSLAQSYLEAVEVIKEINFDYVSESKKQDCPGCDYDGLMPDNMKHHEKCVYRLCNNFLKKVGIDASEGKGRE